MKSNKRKYHSPNIQIIQLDVFISLYMNSNPPYPGTEDPEAFNNHSPKNNHPLLV